ncbi:MAG: hypothetical protein GY775_16820 [Candidatus Scalindua sp.]|nr:hypothetical protein [Candidatus Scalindua sp.]
MKTPKYLIFKNPGLISILDLISMGDSDKREDPDKIGKFDSGLKYALAILYRSNVKFEILSGRNRRFEVDTTILEDSNVNKKKEVLVVKEFEYLEEPTEDICETCNDEYNLNHSAGGLCEGSNCEIMLEAYPVETEHVTGFSPKLGYGWEFWMAFREIYSNCLDEQGDFIITDILPELAENETKFIIAIDEKVQMVLNHWNDYFLKRDLIEANQSIEIHKNTSEHLKIYKNNTLVFEDIDKKAKWSYNWSKAKIDEMRCMQYNSDFEWDLRRALKESENQNLITEICTNKSIFESKMDYDCFIFSEKWVDIVNNFFKFGKLNIVSKLEKELANDSRFKIGIKRISTPNSHYSKTTVKETPTKELTLSFEDTVKGIAKSFNFEIKYPIVESKISNYPVLGDKRSKTLYVTSEFEEKDMWQLIQAQFNIESGKNEYVYKQYVELLKTMK